MFDCYGFKWKAIKPFNILWEKQYQPLHDISFAVLFGSEYKKVISKSYKDKNVRFLTLRKDMNAFNFVKF